MVVDSAPDLPPHLLSIDCQQLASKVHPKRPRVEFSHLGCFLLTNGEQKHHKKLNFINQLFLNVSIGLNERDLAGTSRISNGVYMFAD